MRIIVCLRAVFTRIRSQRRQRQSLSRCATAPLHKGAKEHFIYLAFSFPNWHFLHTGDPSDGLAAASVSLRLGHGAALTCHRHVIHYRAAASLPNRGAKRVQRNHRASPKPLPRSAAPFRGSPQCAHWRKGSPELRYEQSLKERAEYRSNFLPPLCKWRWFGSRRTGGIVQQRPG